MFPPKLAHRRYARLAVIADSHIFPNGARQLSPHILDYFARAEPDLILHAGDICTADVLDQLSAIAPVTAVRGNVDTSAFGDSLPIEVSGNIAGRSIRMIHGHVPGPSAHKSALARSGDIDLLIFGHSHKPLMERAGPTILINPGSPTDRRFEPHFGIAIVDIDRSGIHPELVLFDRPGDLDNATVRAR